MAEKLRAWLETVHDRRISREYDNVVLVIGDEGDGKSNLIIGLLWWWQEIRDRPQTPDAVLEQVAWDRADFQDAMASQPKRSAIAVHDAARVLHRKKAMESEQVETETDMLDVRTKEHVIFLAYQGWNKIPSDLQERRAQHALVVPQRGFVQGYSRDAIDEKYESGDWPEADLQDTYPYLGRLDGGIAECWQAFQEADLDHKRERLQSDDSVESPDEAARRQQIKTVLRSVKPWQPDAGATYRQTAELVDYSKSWVSEVVQDWKHGQYRDIVDEPEGVIA